MKKLIINAVVGLLLFGGALVGGLAATGRLNHDGVANIPLLNSLFPEPPKPEQPEGEAGHEGAKDASTAPGAAPGGETQNADHKGSDGAHPAEATAGGETAADHAAGDPQEPGAQGPHKQKVGRSLVEQPKAEGDGHGGGGGGEHSGGEKGDEKGGEHGGAGHEEAKPDAHAGDAAANAKPDGEHAAERDFKARELALAQERANKYAPGHYFTFQGMPSGITPEQLNEAWQRVQNVLTQLDDRKAVLDQREKELQELVEDIAARQRALGKKADEVAAQQRELDDRIQQFKEQVKLVRNDEIAGLRRNAQTFESFETKKAAELVTDQWRTEEGQAEILKTFEFMNKDKVNEIIQELDNELIKQVLKTRLLVSKEAAAPAGSRK
ncbi:MAG: hypothetical protein U1E73_12805 [Planctomycetota bacterium]